MNFHQPRGAIVATWSVVGAFAVIQAIAWASQGGPGDSRGSVLQTAAAWGVVLTLAAVSTRRILKFKHAIAAHEQAHIQTLEQVVQLELSNAVLQVVARSVDVPLAFQALAERIVRLVAMRSRRPCAPLRERPGIPDLHRPGERGGAAVPASAGHHLQGGAHRARFGREVARAARHRRYERRRTGLPRRQHPAQCGSALGTAPPARHQGARGRHTQRGVAPVVGLRAAADRNRSIRSRKFLRSRTSRSSCRSRSASTARWKRCRS